MKLTTWRAVVVLHSKVWRKGDEDYFPQSHVCVLRTAITRHMASFIDFYFHFLAKLHLICSLYLPMLCHVSHTVSLGYPWFTAQSIYYCGRHFQFLCHFFLLPQIPETVQLSTEKNRQNTELISWPSIERVKLQYRMCQCLRCEFRRSTTGGLQIPLSTELSRWAQCSQTFTFQPLPNSITSLESAKI